MRPILILATFTVVLNAVGANKKKSTFNVPWPGFPHNQPPKGFYPSVVPATHNPEDYYESYDLGDGDLDDMNIPPGVPEVNYKGSTAFKKAIASAVHDFTFDLLRTMVANKTADNILISPLSIYTAVSMLTLGLGGDSKTQALAVLHGSTFDNIHRDMSELSDVLFESERPNVTLTRANRIFVDQSVKLLKPFKRGMKSDYHVSAKKVNFAQGPELNRKRINVYVERHTDHKVKNLAPEGSITTDTKLFIANAMHMQAFWRTPFSDTERAKFLVAPEEIITVELMSAIGPCSFQMDNGLQARVVRNQLKGDLSMVMIVPNTPGDFAAVEGAGGGWKVRRALESLYASTDASGWMPSCQISMPKFKIQHSADGLVQCLKEMGMPDVFDASTADLSAMSPRPGNLYVSDMRHKAAIDVNEQGIEGSAATSITFSARMMPQIVYVDRPFLFIVRDDVTGATLFTGKVVRPSYEQ